MSAFVLANFLQKEAQNNEKLDELLNLCSQQIEQREKLQKENASLEAECFRLDTECFAMEHQIEKMKEIDEVRTQEMENAKSVLANIVATRLQFEDLDFNELAQSKVESCRLQMKNQYEEFKKSAQEVDNIIEHMENRTIVKSLRIRQFEALELQKEINSMKNTFHMQLKSIRAQIDHIVDERNTMIVEIVNYIKNIQRMQLEANATKDSLTQKGSTVERENTKEKSPNFLKILDRDYVPNVKCTKFMQELLQLGHQGTKPTGVRSILRKDTKENASTKENAPTKQVVFATPDDSVSSTEEVANKEVVAEPKACITQSEDVIEADHREEECFIQPAQIIDLVTPTLKPTEKNVTEKPVEKEKVEIQENKLLDSSSKDESSTSSNSSLFLEKKFQHLFQCFGRKDEKLDPNKSSDSFDDTLTFDNIKDGATSSNSNKKSADDFLEFSLDFDEKRDGMIGIGEDFGTFFD